MRSVIRLGNRIAAASRGRMLVIALLASGGCNSQQTGPLSVRLDLRNFGYQFAAGAPVADATELSFLSEDLLAVSVNQKLVDSESHAPPGGENPHATIVVVDVRTGRIVTQGSMPLGTGEDAVQTVSGKRLAVWNSKGLQLCAPDLHCDPPLAGPGPLSVSPKGRRVVFGSYGRNPFKLLDVESLRQVAALDDTEGAYGVNVIPGDTALLISHGPSQFAIHRPGKQDKLMDFDKGGAFGLSQFITDEMFAYLRHSSNEAIVSDLDGRELHRYKVAQAYRTGFLPTASGERFGIYEYGFTFWNSVLNFWDIDDTRPPNFQRVRVIDISSGTEVARVEWDPRQSPLRHSIEPRLSPSGHRLARVVEGVLEVLQVN
jgi:hypothetical protein